MFKQTKKLLKSKKGSTLVMVLIFLAILTMLGTAILSLAVVNYKTSISNKKVKTSFYLAEAGLDEAYALLGEEIEKAVEESNEAIKQYTDANSNDPEGLKHFLDGQITLELQDDTKDESPYANEDGSLVENEVYALINTRFKTHFKSYFDGNLADIITRLETETAYGDLRPKEIDVIEGKSSSFPDISDTARCLITLTSNALHEKTDKRVQATFAVKMPDYNTPYFVNSEAVRMYNNVLWTKALLTEKNIYVMGNGEVTINGDVYAYGTKPTDEWDVSDPLKYGGIVVGDASAGQRGRLTINGSAATNSYIHTKGKESVIKINGNAYCSSLAVEELQDEDIQGDPNEFDENCLIEVNGDVNTYDDIKLNGEKSRIAIQGSYYGFSSGEKGSDRSSSIVINSDDIDSLDPEARSQLTIKADPLISKGKAYYMINNGQTNTIADTTGVFLAGTVYIKTDPDYQTGESVSVKGNYTAYTKEIEDTGIEGFAQYHKDNVDFVNYPPLYLAYKFKNSETKFTPHELSEYLLAVYTLYSEGSNTDPDGPDYVDISLGNGNIDLGNNVKYSLGAYITKKTDSPEKGKLNEGDPIGASTSFKQAFLMNENEYSYYVDKMSNPQIDPAAYITAFPDDPENPAEPYNHIPHNVADLYDFDDILSLPTKNKVTMTDKELYLADATGDTIVIGGPGASVAGSNNKNYMFNSNEEIKGIVVTKGDIIITGALNFRGTIVTEGNIYFVDDHAKTITNDYNAELIGPDNNFVVKKVSEQKKDADEKPVGFYFKTEGSEVGTRSLLSFIMNTTAGVDVPVDGTYKYANLIEVRSWRKIR